MDLKCECGNRTCNVCVETVLKNVEFQIQKKYLLENKIENLIKVGKIEKNKKKS